jgi:type I restriction enzyme M protein
MSDSQFIVQKLWNYCNVLRDDGLSYGDYIEQLSFLLFLKMADERGRENGRTKIPQNYNWQSLLGRKDNLTELDDHYKNTLSALGSSDDNRLKIIFSDARNKIQDPAKLRRLIVDLIDQEEWSRLDTDVKGDAYEGLLQKNAEDTKGGAGQYFTPRPLVRAIVEVMRPGMRTTICDPACGTGGFLLAAHKFILEKYGTRTRKNVNAVGTLHGVELVNSVARLCLMNMVLHEIGNDNGVPIEIGDSLAHEPTKQYQMVLTNPPFGKKGAFTTMTAKGTLKRDKQIVVRKDFWETTNNKQLSFLQHVYTLLKRQGKAAVIVPDNVLFESGKGEVIRRTLLDTCDVHTLLRLPTGLFYAHGVKANVLFFDKKTNYRPTASHSVKPATRKLWIYDLRTNQAFTLKERPLGYEDLKDFITCYKPTDRNNRKSTWTENSPDGKWRSYDYQELIERDKTNLDIFWLEDESFKETLEKPQVIAKQILKDLQKAMATIEQILVDVRT